MIRGGGFPVHDAVQAGAHGTWTQPKGQEPETQAQWTETREHADIDGAPLFFTHPT